MVISKGHLAYRLNEIEKRATVVEEKLPEIDTLRDEAVELKTTVEAVNTQLASLQASVDVLRGV